MKQTQAERYAQEAREVACNAAGEAADATMLAVSPPSLPGGDFTRVTAEAAARAAANAALAAFEAATATRAAERDDPRAALSARTRALVACDEAGEARAAGERP